MDWLAEETGIRRVFLNLAIKALAALVGVAAEEGRSWFGKTALEKFKKILGAIPAYERLVKALGSLLGRFDTEILAKREFKEILAGKRPAAGAEYDEDLALELRGQLRLLQDNQDLARQMGGEFQKTIDALAHIERRLNPQPLLKLKRLSQAGTAVHL